MLAVSLPSPPAWPLGSVVLGPVVGKNQEPIVERAAPLWPPKAKSTGTAHTLQDCVLSGILCPNDPTSPVSAAFLCYMQL